MLLIISPAKTQDFSEYKCPLKGTKPELLSQVTPIIKKLKTQTTAKLETTLGVSKKLAQLNHKRFKEYSEAFTPKNSKPAFLAYKGDVYKGLDVDSYSKTDWNFAQNHVRIITGFYGVLRPLDLMQAYRLEMKTKFSVND